MEAPQSNQPPANPVRIFVSRAGQSTHLRLRDNRNNPNVVDFTPPSHTQQTQPPPFDTDADKGDLIIWELDPLSLTDSQNSGFSPIESIVNVVQTFGSSIEPRYKGSEAILSGDPVNAGNAFVATIPNPSAGKGKYVNYKIVYKLPGDTKEYELDPKLLLNS